MTRMNRILITLAVILSLGLSVTVSAAATYGPTRDQETLWSIASRIKPTHDISVQQVALALYRKNPQAFESANINALKHNVTLQLPTLAEMRSTSYAQAVRTTKHHNQAWQASGGSDKDSAELATTKRDSVTRPRTIIKVVEKPVVVVDNKVRRQQEAEIQRLKQQVSSLSRELASAKNQTRNLRQQLAATKTQTPATPAPVVAVSTASSAPTPTPAQPTAQEIEIARQVQKLSAQVADLESVLEEKNNHIRNLQATLKNASETIKRQYAENQQLVQQLKPNSTATASANGASSTNTVNTTNPVQTTPQLTLAEVGNPTMPTNPTDASSENPTMPASPTDASSENPTVQPTPNPVIASPENPPANKLAAPTEQQSGVWAAEPVVNQPNATMQPTNDVRNTPQPLVAPSTPPNTTKDGTKPTVAQELKLTTPEPAKPLWGNNGTVPPPSPISYVIGLGALGLIGFLWWRSRRDKKRKGDEFPTPEQERRRKTIRQDPVIPFEAKSRDSTKSE